MVEDIRREEIPTIVRPSVQVVLVREGDDGPEVFLGKRKAGGFQNQWSFPGGQVEEGMTSEEAAVEELEQEVGVAITEGDLYHVPERDSVSETIREKEGKTLRYRYQIKVFTVDGTGLNPRNASPAEHSEMRWMSLRAALSMHEQAKADEQATLVMRSPDQIPGVLAPRTLETIKFLAARK